MRRVRNQRPQSANPGLLFARGVEQLVSDHLHHPSRRDEQELQTMQRATVEQEPRGRLFNVLLRQFVF
ncbi:MAG: hypothetical protein OEO19_19270 [Gammaproteobacteria bacterium]|nr:hypothetical protein [Gammaproteobacteria bacterium]MDH3448187.1 hypothetical protein [Gammaproteobacteria bacterium]